MTLRVTACARGPSLLKRPTRPARAHGSKARVNAGLPVSATAAAVALLAQFGSVGTCAQQYPVKPVRIVASEAGGGGDFIARVLAQGLAAAFGQHVVVENRGGGVIAGDLVARSAPDGYTLLVYGNTLWLLPLMRSQVPYDPVRDFLPVSLVTRAPTVLVVHPSVPAKSVKELELLSQFGVFAPAGTPPATVARLNREIVRVMQLPDTKDRLFSAGVEAVGTEPEALAAAIKDEISRMQKVISSAGIRED